MIDLTTIVAPLRGGSPAGIDLRYDPVYAKIRAMRKAAEEKLQGDDETPPTAPETEWAAIRALAVDALTTRSKDLQLAVWLLEVETQDEGFSGVSRGLQLIRGLLERYWDSLFPRLEADDDEPLAFRVGVLEWIGAKLPLHLKRIPLSNSAGEYSLLHYEVTQKTGEEKGEFLSNGWPSSEQFDNAMAGSSVEFLEATAAAIAECQEQFALLEQLTDERFVVRRKSESGTERTEILLSFRGPRDVLETSRWIVDRTLRPKREAGTASAPAPIDFAEREPGDRLARGSVDARVDAPRSAAIGAIVSRQDALARVGAAVDFLIADNALEPTPYVLSRAVAFGVLYAYTDVSDAAPLPSPPTALRERMRALAADQQWLDLVQEAEHAIASSPKQPWLDLHRHVVTALDNLGESYSGAAAAVRGQLRALLARHPALVDGEFADGTPAANRETQQWLKQQGLVGSAPTLTVVRAPAVPVDVDAVPEAPSPSVSRTHDAMSLIRNGRTQDALALLQDHVSAAGSGRERFLRKLELGEICLESGNPSLAFPILDELAGTIEHARLEEWEDKDIVSRAWMALVRCCRQLDGNAQAHARGAEIFARLCRLDISKALSVEHTSPQSASRWFKR